MFPISAKKCEKCKIFSGIFALKFCKFRRFFSCQKPAFLFPTKNCRQLRFTMPRFGIYVAQIAEKSCRTQSKDLFFFWRSTLNWRKRCLHRRDDFFFFEITLKPDKNDEEIFDIFTLSLERSNYFRHFRRR